MDFKLADVYQDSNVLKMANEAANWLEEEKIDLLKILPDYERTSSVIIVTKTKVTKLRKGGEEQWQIVHQREQPYLRQKVH